MKFEPTPENAAALIQIVGLVSLWVNEQRHIAADRRLSFTAWASGRNHGEVIMLLSQQPALFEALQIAIQNDIQELAESIEQISRNLAALTFHLPVLDQIKYSIPPELVLHETPISMLRILVESKRSKLVIYQGAGAPIIQIVGDEVGLKDQQMGVPDVRYLQDDLDSLAALRLIIPGFTANGLREYRLTRAGSSFIERLDSKSAPTNPGELTA